MRGAVMRSHDLVEYLAGNWPCSKREPGNEGDAILFTTIYNLILLAIGKAVPVLHRNNRNDPPRTPDVFLRPFDKKKRSAVNSCWEEKRWLPA
jgi:hypothetical protein